MALTSNGHGWRTAATWAWLPILLLGMLVGIAQVSVPRVVFYDPGWLILLGNTLFVTVVGFVVAIIALRNYRATGRIQMLLLGCGVLVFGLGGILAGAVRDLPDGANLNVTVYNSGALLGGLFHFVAAMMLLAGVAPGVGAERKTAWLVAGYAGSVVFILVVTGAALARWIPAFFVQGEGPTVLRQHILSAAAVLFVFSFLIFFGTYRRNHEAFLYWYSGALALTAVSLTAFLMERSVGSPVGWLGRLSQYVGGGYFLVALVTARRSADSRHISLDAVLTESLSGAEERFRALADNLPDVVLRFDHELRHVYVNPAGLRFYGKPAGSVIGRALEDVGLPPKHCREWRQRVEDVFSTGRQAEVEEYVTAGRARYYQSRCVPEYGADGTVATVLVISHDLTDRKSAEESLRGANERLRESDRRKDEFLAVLSHELRGPLTPICNSAFVLQNAPPASEQARRAQAIIERQSAQLTRLVDDLLDLNRISRGKIELQRERVDLGELVERTAEDYRPSFHDHAVRLEAGVPRRKLWVDADPTRVAQVIGNLLGNACKFTPAGGSVHVKAAAEDGRAVVRVRDTGRGIAPELLEKIFDPFIQAEQTLARSYGGLGLGLALVKAFVEMHGGDVVASSAGPGRGAEFAVRLPLLKAVEPVRARPANAVPARRLRLLVVDDNRDAAESLRDVVTSMGHDARLAFDGRSGLAVARETPPDFVLCDVGLPDIDGYAVARELRADPRFSSCQLVALTGYAQPSDLARASAAGFDRHLAKPPSLDKLRQLLAGAATDRPAS